MKNLLLAAILLSVTGCVGLIGAQHLTAEQITAMKEYNGDIYACLSITGPPPLGGGIFLLVPKGVRPDIQFSPSCQIISGVIATTEETTPRAMRILPKP